MTLGDEMKEAIKFREETAREWGNLAFLSVMAHDRDMIFIARKHAEMYRNEAKKLKNLK